MACRLCALKGHLSWRRLYTFELFQSFLILAEQIGSSFFDGLVDERFGICRDDADIAQLENGVFPIQFFARCNAIDRDEDGDFFVFIFVDDVECRHENANVRLDADDDERLRNVWADAVAERAIGEARKTHLFNANGIFEFFG